MQLGRGMSIAAAAAAAATTHGSLRAHRSSVLLHTITTTASSTSSCALSAATTCAAQVASSSPLPLSIQRRCVAALSAASATGVVTPPAAPSGPASERTNKPTSSNTSAATATTKTADDVVPTTVLQRVNGSKQELLRLLQHATEGGAVSAPVVRVEAMLRQQLGLYELAQCQTSSSSVTIPPSWMAAVWAALAPHCLLSAAKADASDVARRGRSSSSSSSSSTQSAAVSVQVVPFDWAAAVESLAARLPYEGWSEMQVYADLHMHHRIIDTHTLVWLPRFTQADSLAHFLHKYFSRVVVVTRSAVTGHPLVHCVGRNSVSVTWSGVSASESAAAMSSSSSSSSAKRTSSAACDALQHALHTLGRGHQLPVWSDSTELAPLMSARSGLSTAQPHVWKSAWLQDAQLRRCFHLSGYVRVRATPVSSRLLIIIDATALEGTDDAAASTWQWLEEALERPDIATAVAAAGTGTSIKLLTRPSTSPSTLLRIQQLTASTLGGGAAVVVDTVVVDALLESHHMLGALLEAEAAAGGGAATTRISKPHVATKTGDDTRGGADDDKDETTGAAVEAARVFVLCGAASRGVFEETLKEVQRAGLQMTLLTPTAA
jgi:hypothetical protein